MKALPFLMFQGDAKPALDLYRAVFPDFEQIAYDEHPEGDLAGKVAMARIRIAGQEVMLFDSPPVHAFTFTPASSFFIDCEDEAQLQHMARALGDGGGTLMAIDNYGFSTLYTWITDRFGVSWQINLA